MDICVSTSNGELDDTPQVVTRRFTRPHSFDGKHDYEIPLKHFRLTANQVLEAFFNFSEISTHTIDSLETECLLYFFCEAALSLNGFDNEQEFVEFTRKIAGGTESDFEIWIISIIKKSVQSFLKAIESCREYCKEKNIADPEDLIDLFDRLLKEGDCKPLFHEEFGLLTRVRTYDSDVSAFLESNLPYSERKKLLKEKPITEFVCLEYLIRQLILFNLKGFLNNFDHQRPFLEAVVSHLL